MLVPVAAIKVIVGGHASVMAWAKFTGGADALQGTLLERSAPLVLKAMFLIYPLITNIGQCANVESARAAAIATLGVYPTSCCAPLRDLRCTCILLAAFEAFPCHDFEGGRGYLKADVPPPCGSNAFRYLQHRTIL